MRPADVYLQMMADTLKVAHPNVERVEFFTTTEEDCDQNESETFSGGE